MNALARLVRARGFAWALFGAVALIVFLSPMVLTSRTFQADWPIHLWVSWNQYLNLAGIGHPEYFLQSDHGAFFPWYGFYGGTLYSTVGGIAAVLGGRVTVAYVAVWGAAFAAALGGWTWLTVQLGVRGWRAFLPGLTFVTSAYYVTVVYGRGAFPEAVATSMIPLVAASALHLLRAADWRVLPSLVFLASATILTGSHTNTLVWGPTALLFGAAIAFVAVPREHRPPFTRGGRVALLGTLAIGLNLWFLLPVAAFNDRVVIGVPLDVVWQPEFTQPEHLFDILRQTPQLPGVPAVVNAQVPVLALVWAGLALAVGWRWTSRAWRRAAIGAAIVLAALLALVIFEQAMLDLPRLWRYLQFPYRLMTYVGLFVSLLVLLGLRTLPGAASGRWPRVAIASLVLITAGSAALGVAQAWEVPSPGGERARVFESPERPPPGWYIGRDYADRSRPVVSPSLPQPLVVALSGPRRSRYTATLPPGPAGTVATNVAAGPYLVQVAGARPVGRTPDGSMVVEVAASARRPREVAFSPTPSAARRLGIAASLASLLACPLVLFWIARGAPRLRLRTRR